MEYWALIESMGRPRLKILQGHPTWSCPILPCGEFPSWSGLLACLWPISASLLRGRSPFQRTLQISLFFGQQKVILLSTIQYLRPSLRLNPTTPRGASKMGGNLRSTVTVGLGREVIGEHGHNPPPQLGGVQRYENARAVKSRLQTRGRHRFGVLRDSGRRSRAHIRGFLPPASDFQDPWNRQLLGFF